MSNDVSQRPSTALSRLLLLVAFIMPVSTALAAGTLDVTERISFNRPEAWAMKYFTSVSLLTSLGTPRPSDWGTLNLGLEAGWIPSLSAAERTVGFNGVKEEDLNKLPAFGRVRLAAGLPLRLSLTLAYVPPIPINGVTSNVFSFSLGRPFSPLPHLTLGVSANGQVGSVKGDFVCPESEVRAGQDPQRNPFDCTQKSRDRVKMNYVGLEASGAYRIPGAYGLTPFATLAFTYMNLAFHVNARYGGIEDHTKLKTDGVTFSGTAGLLYPINSRLEVSGAVFYSPLRVKRPQNPSTTTDGLFNVRAMVAYRFL